MTQPAEHTLTLGQVATVDPESKRWWKINIPAAASELLITFYYQATTPDTAYLTFENITNDAAVTDANTLSDGTISTHAQLSIDQDGESSIRIPLKNKTARRQSGGAGGLITFGIAVESPLEVSLLAT